MDGRTISDRIWVRVNLRFRMMATMSNPKRRRKVDLLTPLVDVSDESAIK